MIYEITITMPRIDPYGNKVAGKRKEKHRVNDPWIALNIIGQHLHKDTKVKIKTYEAPK